MDFNQQYLECLIEKLGTVASQVETSKRPSQPFVAKAHLVPIIPVWASWVVSW